MRIVTLFVRNGTAKYPDAERRLQELFAAQMPDVTRDLVIIDNALPASFSERLNGETNLIGGDNTFWEFSAWDKGIAWLGEKIWSYDLVHIATSAFYTLYVDYLHRFTSTMLSLIARRPICLGHIDCYNEPVRILSFQSRHWIRTSFLFLPPTELKILRGLVSLRTSDLFFQDAPGKPFADDCPACGQYQQYVVDWLTGADIGQGVTWHSRLDLSAESRQMFREKAVAIFNEHLLSIRLRAQSTRLIDATWLATQLSIGKADSIDWDTDWTTQLAERDRGSLVAHDPSLVRASG